MTLLCIKMCLQKTRHALVTTTSFVNKQHLTVYSHTCTFVAMKKTQNLLQRFLSPVAKVETSLINAACVYVHRSYLHVWCTTGKLILNDLKIYYMYSFQCCIPPQWHTWRMSFTGTIEYLEAPDFLLLELFSGVENKFASLKSTKF